MDGSGKPYEQIAASLRRRIVVGEWGVGDRLPTNRELAEQYRAATNTIGNAISLLRDEDVLITQQGRGTFVRSLPAGTEVREPSSDFKAVLDKLDQVQHEMRALDARLARLESAAGLSEAPADAAPEL